MSSLVWFRSDLRVDDNAALEQAGRSGGEVHGLFLVAPQQWQRHDWGARRQAWTWRNVLELRTALARVGVPLHVAVVPRFADAPAAVLGTARRHGLETIHASAEYGVDECARDAAVARAASADGLHWRLHHQATLLPPGTVRTREGTPFRVFTPFRRAWLARARELAHPSPPSGEGRPPIEPPPLPDWQPPPARIDATQWPAGEQAARDRLHDFVHRKLARYAVERDVPARDATSRLSPYLATGAISVRRCFEAALAVNQGEWDTGGAGATCWINELIWREFYLHALHAFPQLSRHRAFRPATEAIPWLPADEAFTRWQEGLTGFPLVDAGMRQLAATGWMHNRLRMLCAMFLSKYLLVDWRHGERHFMQQLLDGELAANNGGWQWCASTGTDAAPYFRLLSPERQASRFDPDGEFVRDHVRELRHCSTRALLHPGDPELLAAGYPAPMIDLGEARKRVLAAHAGATAAGRT